MKMFARVWARRKKKKGRGHGMGKGFCWRSEERACGVLTASRAGADLSHLGRMPRDRRFRRSISAVHRVLDVWGLLELRENSRNRVSLPRLPGDRRRPPSDKWDSARPLLGEAFFLSLGCDASRRQNRSGTQNVRSLLPQSRAAHISVRLLFGENRSDLRRIRRIAGPG